MLALIVRIIRQNHRRHLAGLLIGIVVVMVAGGGAFAASQGRSFGVGLYWAVTTAATVGYGDVIPHTSRSG